MANSDTTKNDSNQLPAAEELKPKAEENAGPSSEASTSSKESSGKPGKVTRRRGPYRPSHKAMFIGLIVAGLILAINAVIITFVLRHQSNSKSTLNTSQVTISSSALDKLGVNSSSIGDSGIQLTVGPNARFNSNVQIAGDTSIAGKLTLNSTFVASSANLTQLQAGNTTLGQLNVNGNATVNDLNLRNNLAVAGITQLQGQTTVSQGLTIGGSLSVAGNALIGGALQVGAFQTDTLTIAGHVTTVGSPPSASRGAALGTYGSVSISGNDTAGTVAANAGTGAGSGAVVTVTFNKSYSNIPHVVITSIGQGLVAYVSRSASGFTIYVSALTPLSAGNGYAFDYIVEQ